ncbi:Phenylcoumaran benzylic ether reductase Betv6 [Linum perenne]
MTTTQCKYVTCSSYLTLSPSLLYKSSALSTTHDTPNPINSTNSSSQPQMAEKSKILIIGGTGYIGKFIVEASLKAGHPTFVLVREATVSDPVKGKLVDSFKSSGATLLHLADQTKIISAIKEAGNVKRFLPSEFGNDVDHVHAVEPAKTAFETKASIRRAIEAEGIPYTYVPSNLFAGYFLPTLGQPGLTSPPRDKITILGDGNTKAVLNKEDDIGTYTIRAVEDPRTLNKTLLIKPPKNIYSINELVALWEKKIGKTLEKTYVPEDQLLKTIQESPIPLNIILSISHSVFVKGDQTNFDIEPAWGVEASELYPDVKYTTVEEYLSQFI